MKLRIALFVAGLLVCTGARAADAPPPLLQDAFVRWVHADPGRAKQVQAFEAFLRREGVANVLPTSQLLLNASSWQACGVAPYSLAPRALWANVVPTLRFIRARIVPALGPVAAVSGYRDPDLNKCSGGAAKSAHAEYYALDLIPLRFNDRDKMIAEVCQIHARFGPAAHAGLGFYQGMRFHIDTEGYRTWGSDYHAATSPCVTLTARR